MKIAKRRVSCPGCRGYFRGHYHKYCQYGFKTEYRMVPSHGLTKSGEMSSLFPAEPCPRPRNYEEHSEALEWEFTHREERRKQRQKDQEDQKDKS